MELKIRKHFNIVDVGNVNKVRSILQEITVTSNYVQLDLLGCLIDYPATAMLIDKLLGDLANKDGEKGIVIKVDFYLPQQTLLNWLLLGSSYFGIEKNKELPLSQLEEIISLKLNQDNINLTIEITNRKKEKTNEYNYPKE